MRTRRAIRRNDAAARKHGSMGGAQGPPNTENGEFADQKSAARFDRVEEQVLAEPRLFAAQGAVVAGWRVYRRRRLGPYFRLAYRQGKRQRSIYLGRCRELVRRVRALLARLQGPRRQRRAFRRLEAQVRASLRRSKARLREMLAPWGIQLKGFEFRGSRRGIVRYGLARYGAALPSVFPDCWSSAFRRPLSGRFP